jgi:two-component system, NtrC family, response regulator GlrR
MQPLILVIDGDSDTSALLGDRLAAFGFDVIETHKPGHALMVIKNWAHTRRSFNGILLNLKPPFQDSLDIIQELVELHPEIPVIVLCAWPDAHLLVEAREKGARDIILRPVDLDLLELKCIKHFVVPPYDES